MNGGFNNSTVNGRGRSFLEKRSYGQPRAAVPTRLVRWALTVLVLAVVLAASAFAQNMNTGGIMAPPANVKPAGLENVGINQRLEQQIPLELSFRDETGKTVQLGDYIGKKPVILNFVYYRCPMLCPELLIGLESSLKVLKFNVARNSTW